MDYVSEYLYWGDLAGLPFILENKTAAIIMAEVIQDAKNVFKFADIQDMIQAKVLKGNS